MLYKINGAPEGITAYPEAIAALQGLTVEGEKSGDKIVVEKEELLKALNTVELTKWVDYWGKVKPKGLTFPAA